MATDITAVDYLTRSVDRNRYFYGKLMTVRDFLREQEYFNSKRWLINRLLFGSGVVCGLEVAAVGGTEKTVVEIQPGVAFDPVGREITVSNRERVDLAKLDLTGLAPGGTAETNLLVCLTYHECPKEPVPSLSGSPCDEVCESNRVGETFTVGLIKAPPDAQPPTPCENWLNRQTVRRPSDPPQASDNFLVERVAPVWVRQGQVFEVALKVTALKDINDVEISETVAGGKIIEPNPQPPTQFPTTPVSLRKGEFFIYAYQVQAPAAIGEVQLSGGAGVPTPPAKVLVVDETQAKAREAEMRLALCQGDPEQKCVPIAKVKAAFNGSTLTGVTVVDTFNPQRFRYNLTRVAELLDCVRTSLRAEAESPRPGHLFITFKDLERTDLLPIGPAVDHGKSYTVPRGDHVHALLLHGNSGLQFVGNKLRIEGDVGGEKINFLNTVSGQNPTEPQHLTTKHYVDSSIAGLDWQESVLDKDAVKPPDAPAKGARYLLFLKPAAGTDWEGHKDSIATWAGKQWNFTEPDEGTAVFVDDDNIAYLFVEGKWIPFLATPEVAAGDGLRADGAVISVGEGPGLKVNPNDVEVVYEANLPSAVGPTPSAGATPTAARGDHTHHLPLTPNGGLIFGSLTLPGPTGEDKSLAAEEKLALIRGLHINGLVEGPNINFRHPVWGQNPTEPRHLATKQYVDGLAAGLDWQNSVLDKDLTAPPRDLPTGARYLVLRAVGSPELPGPFEPPPDTELPPESLAERGVAGDESVRETPTEPAPDPSPRPFPFPFPFPLPIPLPRNPWMGHENSIATWDGNAWSFTDANEGKAVFVEDENTAYLFVDGKWVPFMAMPSVAAGAGLRADGASLSVGQGTGLRVNENDVEVVFNAANPAPVGPTTFAGGSPTAARGDHSHELPLVLSGGLEFVGEIKPDSDGADESAPREDVEKPNGAVRLRVNGRINGDAIDFLNPVLGQDPVAPRHLATKQYVDGVTAGLTWQSTVLDKDLSKPPEEPAKGDRYLLFVKTAADTPWEGRQDTIATWAGRKWDFIAPTEGMAAFVADENLAYLYADGRWVPFLAPPAAVGAGDGLFQQGTDLAVGQGRGVVVTADAVSVNFGADAPPSVGLAATGGNSGQAAQSDHTHDLPLALSGGLEFVFVTEVDDEGLVSYAPADAEANAKDIQFLRVNGQVSGDSIDFQFPVAGQAPTDARHLVTKEYVDGKGLGAVAGEGLVGKENILSVGGGPGLVVGADQVRVNFENSTAQPVGPASSPGSSNTVSRGDHVHAMPDIWGTSVSTGVVAFDMKDAGKQRHTISLPIDPGLGAGPITVVVGLESLAQGEATFVGDMGNFEEAMIQGGGFRQFPPVMLGAAILPGGFGRTGGNSTFEIWAKATPRSDVLPDAFSVRWWAYKPGHDLGTIFFSPKPPAPDR
ncbi:MAG: DUF2793 domain-containing protein [Pyrinomonadaceae bacterium]